MALAGSDNREFEPAAGGVEGSVPVIEATADVQVMAVDQGGWRITKKVSVTEKRLVLVEEVRITGVQGAHRAPQQVSLRKETVSFERLAPEPGEPGE